MNESINIQGFRNIQKIVPGPFWTMYRAERLQSETWHLLQVLHESVARDIHVVELYKKMRNIKSVLHHDNILTPLEVEQTDTLVFLLYEDFDAHPILPSSEKSARLSAGQAVLSIKQVAEALQFAQIRGIRHGWVTPNVILKSHQNEAVKVFGFGSEPLLADLYDKNPEIAAAVNPYIPPENLGLSTQPKPDDCYALGVTCYQCFTGEMPFTGNTTAALREQKLKSPAPIQGKVDDIPEDVSTVVLSMIHPKPKFRATYSALLNVVHPEGETDDPINYSVGNHSGLTRVKELVTDINPLNKGTVDKSKKRTVISMAIVAALILFVSIFVIIRLTTDEEERLQQIYNEYLAEQQYEELNESSTYTWDSNETESDSVVENAERNSLLTPTLENDDTALENTMLEDDADEKIIKTVPETTNVPISVFATADDSRADIYVDGQLLGQSDADGNFLLHELLVNKTYRLAVVKNSFQRWEKSVYIKDDKPIKVDLTPNDVSIAEFTFKAVSFADKIRLNSENVARNLPCKVEMPSGPLTVTYMDSRSGFTWSTRLDLKENDPDILISAETVGSGEIVVVLENPIEYGYAFVTLNDNDSQYATPFKTSVPVGWHRIRVFRDSYTISPADTSVFVQPGDKLNLRCKVLKLSDI